MAPLDARNEAPRPRPKNKFERRFCGPYEQPAPPVGRCTRREERLTNPFVRVAEKDVVAKVNERLKERPEGLSLDHSPQAVLAAVRAMKDAF